MLSDLDSESYIKIKIIKIKDNLSEIENENLKELYDDDG
jgi:hypothetical protein